MADPFTSNGTCYYASGQKADPSYIPCGNAALGTVPCCQVGDYCLSNNACFNNQFGNVYFAGCTAGDTYNNEAACPRKYTLQNQQWVGMVRCFQNTNDKTKDDIWQGCHESIQPLNTIGEPCKCTLNKVDGLYTSAPGDLPREALLPTTTGGPITFASGFGPSNTAVTATSKVNLTELTISPPTIAPQSGWYTLSGTATVGGSGGSGAAPYTGGPSATNTNPPSSDGDGGLSTGAKAGIGVGAAVGGLALIGILWCLYLLNRRVSRHSTTASQPPAPTSPMTMGAVSPSPGPDYQQYGYIPAAPESPKPVHSATAFAHPSELEGSHYQVVGPEVHGWKSELPANENIGVYEAQTQGAQQTHALSHSPIPGTAPSPGASYPAQFQGYSPSPVPSSAVGSDYTGSNTLYTPQQTPHIGAVSPQTTGEGSTMGHYRNASYAGTMDSISETRR